MIAAAALTLAATALLSTVEWVRMAAHQARTRRALARIGYDR